MPASAGRRQDDIGAVLDDAESRPLIIQPVLTYILYCVQNATADHVRSTVTSHFTAKEHANKLADAVVSRGSVCLYSIAIYNVYTHWKCDIW